MAYNQTFVQRLRDIMQQQEIGFYEKTMFGGLCFMVDDKMCVCTKTDKKAGYETLLCRIGENEASKALKREEVVPMDSSGKSMRDFVYVLDAGELNARELAHWVKLCLDYNPIAQSSKKK